MIAVTAQTVSGVLTLISLCLFCTVWLKKLFQKQNQEETIKDDTIRTKSSQTESTEQIRGIYKEPQFTQQTSTLGIGIGLTLNDRYFIEKELGRGSIGIVYLARDKRLMNKPVVVKCLLEKNENLDAQNWYQKKFLQEQEALVRINHPGVVGILESGETSDGKLYLVMQFVDGRNLEEVIAYENVALKRIANIIKQVGQAVSAAHDKGVLHCDLKPANIMLQDFGDGEDHVKVIDFGVAKIAGSQIFKLTDSTRVAGSPAYMAPEQIKGTPSISSDIYALGVMAYKMVTGQLPFLSNSMVGLYEKQRQGVEIKPRDLHPDLSESAEAVILKALSFEPQDRYAQARDFGNDLALALMREPLSVALEDAAPRIALLYKRNAEPDCQVLELLETQFRLNGYDVFIDRHLSVGMEWAKEIERQIRTADVVIALLSAASSQSEMLAYELQIAYESAQKQNGKPRILPVRLNYEESLPASISIVLEPIQYALWNGEQDNQRLVDELLAAVQNPAKNRHTGSRKKIEVAGGAVPLDSEFYIIRPTDNDFLAAISRHDSIILVKGARQMGKTSLLARGLQKSRQEGAKVVFTDFQKLNANHLQSAETFFMTLGEMIADQLDLEVFPDAVWNPRRGANINFERYLKREVLGKIGLPLVWGMDEVDRLFTCNFASEVFGLFRSWHNERSLDPTCPWQKLTLAIVYATEAHLFITDLNQSPFNVGTRLLLKDFALEQVAQLNRRYDSPLQDAQEVERFFQIVSGQPYLVRRGLQELATHSVKIAEFEQLADREDGPFGDHLRRMLVLLAQDGALCDIVRNLLQGMVCPTTESFYRLRSAGLLTGDSTKDARLRCKLYETYLTRHLL